jgi:hypothetical protein
MNGWPDNHRAICSPAISPAEPGNRTKTNWPLNPAQRPIPPTGVEQEADIYRATKSERLCVSLTRQQFYSGGLAVTCDLYPLVG